MEVEPQVRIQQGDVRKMKDQREKREWGSDGGFYHMAVMKLETGVLLSLMCLAVGCSSMGGSQLENTVYDSHRRIVGLDQGLGGSVDKLNETTAELVARVNQSDQQSRTLQSMLEENQVKLETLQQTIDNLTVTLYRQLNLSPPPSSLTTPARPGAPRGPSELEVQRIRVSPPPPGTAPSAIEPRIAPSTPEPGRTPTVAPDVTSGDPEADYQRAQRSYANENYAIALEQFDAYLQRYPNTELCANSQFWKGYCYYNLGKHEEAIGEFEKLRAGYPNHSKVPFGMYIQAMAHKQLGQMARAEALLKEVVAKYPDTAAGMRSQTDLEKLQGN